MALEGTLSDFSLADIIQLISLGRKTGEVVIDAGNNGDGSIFFRGGRIVTARLSDMPAFDAIYTFFTFDDGTFRFVEGTEPPGDVTPLNVSNESIIMEGTRRADEWQRLRERISSLDLVVGLMSDPMASGREEINLRPDEWKVLTLVNGQQDIRAIARRSGFGDFKTAKIIYNLMLAGLVQVIVEEPVAALPAPALGVDLYDSLSTIATQQIPTARVFLDDAFRRMGVAVGQPAPFDSAMGICSQFEKAVGMLLGPSRARSLGEQMRAYVRQNYGQQLPPPAPRGRVDSLEFQRERWEVMLIGTKPLALARHGRYLALAFLALACFSFGPTPAQAAPSPSVVINEYYAPVGGDRQAQWIELVNRSPDPILLNGWTLATSNQEFALPAITLKPGDPASKGADFVLITFNQDRVRAAFPAISGTTTIPLNLGEGVLNPAADMLLLRAPGGTIADEIGWGPVDKSWKNAAFTADDRRTPVLDRDHANGDPLLKSVGRVPDGRDTDSATDFVVRDSPSPGGKLPAPRLNDTDLRKRPTDYISVVAGVLLWIGFVMVALIARRFQNLSGQNTYWQALLIAPVGILIYTWIQAAAFFDHNSMTDQEKWIGFLILLLSAVLCIYVISVFRRIAGRYLEGTR